MTLPPPLGYLALMFLERESELGVAEEFLDGVCRGEGGIAVLEGPPGIGKTALLGEVGASAGGRGVDVLTARASQLDQGFSFGVMRQLLERRLREAPKREREALLAGAAEDALTALGIAGEAGQDEGDAGMRALNGLYWLAANLAGRGPLLLCLDDAHWADRSSLRWLLYVAPRIAELPLGVAIATRPSEPGAEQDLLDGLAQDDSTTVVGLRPLPPAAVGVLVDAGLPGATAPEFEAACHHSTGGNPLLVRELLRELSAEGAAPSAERAALLEGFGVDAVARNVRRRLRALGPEAGEVARAVAVVGDGATVAEVAALCEIDEAAVREAAVGLAATDLLQVDPPLAFVHPLVRAAVYEEMAAVQREQMHRRVADLRRGSANPEGVAIHLLQVEPRSDPSVIETLRAAAADAVGQGAPDAAVIFLRRALAEPPAAGEARAAVLVELGFAEIKAWMNGFDDHLQAAIAETDDAEAAAEIAIGLGAALLYLGEVHPAFEVLERALTTIDESSPLRPRLEAELLVLGHGYPPLRPRVETIAERRLDQLAQGEPVDALLQGALSPWLLEQGDPEECTRVAEAAIADERLFSAPMDSGVVPIVGYMLLGAGRVARADAVFAAAIAASRPRGELPMLSATSAFRSETLFRKGELVAAEAEASFAWDHAIGDAAGSGRAGPMVWVYGTGLFVNVLVARGKLEQAESCLDRLPATLPPRTEMLLPARAELRLAQGRTVEAVADLRATGELLGEQFFKPVQNWRARLAVVLASSGEHEEARELAAAELAQARRWGVPLATGVALTAAGVVAGDEEGIGLLEEAVATLAPTDGRLDHALALIELGALQRRLGSRVAAREPLRVGLDLATRCGAIVHADRAHAELVAAGARPRRDRRFLSGPESLTAGELRVATLAAEGLTDRAIAERLFVTQAAVQFHLRNTFRKLDIRARGDLAAILEPALSETKP